MYRRTCRCPIKPGMDYYQLLDNVVPHNCCAPQYLCTELDKALREAEVTRDRRAQYNKRLRKQGFTDEQISEMPQRRRRGNRIPYPGVNLEF